MKFKVYYKLEKRYLTDYELENNFVGHGPDFEYLYDFRVNLSTGKIQTDMDNSCGDSDCCSPFEMYYDDDDFVIEIDNSTEEDLAEYLHRLDKESRGD